MLLRPRTQVVQPAWLARTRSPGVITINAAVGVCTDTLKPQANTTNVLTRSATGIGATLYAGTATIYGNFPCPVRSIGTGDFTLALFFTSLGDQTANYTYAIGSNTTFAFAVRHTTAANNAAMYLAGSVVSSGQMLSSAGTHVVVVTRKFGTLYFNIDGVVSNVASVHSVPAITNLVLNSYTTAGGSGVALGAHYHLAALETRAWSDQEQRAFLDNPWSLFLAPPVRRYFSTGGSGAALVGDAIAQSSALGALTTGIPVAGAALTVAGSSGALTTGIPLSGASAAVTGTAGDLSAQISFSADALAQAIASAAMSSGIILTADAVAQAAAQGSLDTIIAMLGAATGQASATGSLDSPGTGAALAGAAGAASSATAALTIQIRLEVAALAQAAAAAGLDTAILMAGLGVGASAAGGSMTTAIPLDATALSAAIATGGLSAIISLSGQATGVAGASGALDTQILMAGQATASSAASVTFAPDVLPQPDPRYLVEVPARDYLVIARRRRYAHVARERNYLVRMRP